MAFSSGTTAGRIASVVTALVVASAVAVAAASPASAAGTEAVPVVAVPEVAARETGLSDDAEDIAAAANEYTLGDASGAVALVEAAAADEAGVIGSADNDAVAVGEGATLAADGAGAVLTDETGREFGIAFADAAADSDVEMVDGAAVAKEALPATDVVARAVAGGVQLVAVLAEQTASTSIDFDLTLPEGAQLTEQWDGSIAVAVPTEEVVYDPADEARFDAEVAAIVGDATDVNALTDEQWAAIDALQGPVGTVETVMETVATVAPPWAVDANGVEHETSYVLDGTTLTQVITTDDTTAFPVVADPAWYVWVATATACVAELGSFVFAAAKLAGIVAKVAKIVKASATLTKIVKRIGGVQSAVKGYYYVAKGWVEGKATKYVSASKLADLKTLASKGGSLLADALGVGSCLTLISWI